MNRILYRLIAFLLVPCLVADPSLGSTFSTRLGAPLWRRSSSNPIPFASQALSSPEIVMSAPPIVPGEIRQSSAIRRREALLLAIPSLHFVAEALGQTAAPQAEVV